MGSARALRETDADCIIRQRRSIRRYEDRPVPRDTIIALLEAACCAPSPHNRQPWRFAVLTEAAPKAQLAEAMGERLRADRSQDGDPPELIDADVARSRARIRGAPAVIVVALSMADMDTYPDARRRNAEYLMAAQATAAATQTLLLAAEAKGLRSCWMCAPLFCPETVRSALSLPGDWEPQALVTLGYSSEAGRRRPRRPLADAVLWIEERT
jgi:F420 biosynthesis protein FbiB-like protein